MFLKIEKLRSLKLARNTNISSNFYKIGKDEIKKQSIL